MTDIEIEATINRMKLTPDLKAVLRKQCADGNANARFAVYAYSKTR